MNYRSANRVKVVVYRELQLSVFTRPSTYYFFFGMFFLIPRNSLLLLVLSFFQYFLFPFFIFILPFHTVYMAGDTFSRLSIGDVQLDGNPLQNCIIKLAPWRWGVHLSDKYSNNSTHHISRDWKNVKRKFTNVFACRVGDLTDVAGEIEFSVSLVARQLFDLSTRCAFLCPFTRG